MGISREQLVVAFVQAGKPLWVVGGALRDELRGVPGHDEDFASAANPDEIEAISRSTGAHTTAVGKQWGTIGVLADGTWREITTFRGDQYTAGSRWPEVTFAERLEDDLARRDFTINAFARPASGGELVDLFGGMDDLAAQRIRAVGDPATRFREDPLRILRGLRFVSQLDFEIDPATLAGMAETASLLATLSKERVTAELDRLLSGIAPARALSLTAECGALAVILPELDGMAGCEQNHFHRFDVWGHTLATVEAIDSGLAEERSRRRWTALLHDVGKPAVRHTKPNGEWGFYRHETVGAELAEALLDRLSIGQAEARAIVHLIRRHMDRPDPAEARSVRRFMKKCELHGRHLWPDLIALKRADNASHTYVDDEYHDALQAACERIAREEADRLRAESPLTGDDLVALTGRKPGPWIRPIKEQLSAMVLDGDLAPGDKAAAIEAIKDMGSARTD